MPIRYSINQARERDTHTRALRRFVEVQLPALHHLVQLPDVTKIDTLIGFLTLYIECVPDFIDSLIVISKEAGIQEPIAKLVNIAQTFFTQSTTLPQDHQGLHALINEAYLAHRLMEEVNDRIMRRCGIPLTPMDMTLSNVIVHNMLGDQFANQLDLAVHHAIERLFNDSKYINNALFTAYINWHQQEGWHNILGEWPCLARELSIGLELIPRPNKSEFH